jgi:Arc/MetJ-type ribon-helix-helix transcriptional regulator
MGMIICNTRRYSVSTAKIAITIEEDTLRRLDILVKKRFFRSRSRAIQDSIKEKLERIDRGRLARESAKLDPKFERALAEEGIAEELSKWPEY